MGDVQIQSNEECRLCLDCNKTFATKVDFEIHLCIQTRKCHLLCLAAFERRCRRGVHCCICDRKFSGRRDLANHMNTHTGKKPHICPHCEFRSTTSSYLSVHIVRKHTKEFKHNCSFCSRGYVHKSELQKHIQIVHRTEETRESIVGEKGEAEEKKKDRPVQLHCCPHCTFITKIKRNLTRHLWTHSSLRPYQCQFCDKGYTKNDQFMDHLRTHTGERPFVCNTCGRGFFSKPALRTHERSHPEEHMFLKNPSKSPRRRRKKNNKSTDSPGNESLKVQSFQTSEGLVVLVPVDGKGCALVCDTTQKGLDSNVLLQSEAGDEMHHCPLCPFSASESSMEEHLQTHSNELPHCGVCERVVTDKESHLATCKGIQTVRCKFCKKAFTKVKIDEHQSACKDKYPFACIVCGEAFRSESVLELHENHLHSRSLLQKKLLIHGRI